MSIFSTRNVLLAAVIAGGIAFYFNRPADGPLESPPDTAPTIALIDDERIRNAHQEPGNWLSYGRSYGEQRFSPLDQINRENVANLGLAWFADMRSTRALEATPIVVDGMMFLSSEWSRVHAFDARTGEELWFFDPQVPGEWGRKACCDVVNRGVAVYKGRVYVATLDGRLVALDAASGKPVWEVDTLIDRQRDYTITGAPRVARGKVYIGNGGAEYGVRGYITAYDAKTGEQAWRFFTVPGDPSEPFEHPEMELAAQTWKGGEWWKVGGGGTVWNSIVYDPEFNHLYFGVGNGAPWSRVIRSPGGGDNLFLSSIVAVDADTGEMQWYYQTTPGDNWDYTAVQDMVLADLEVEGVERKVLMQAPKNGFFYVLDRSDGKLLRAHRYTAVTWATHVDLETGRPVEAPEQGYVEKARWVLPGPLGGHNWQAMSYDSDRRLMYIPTQEAPMAYGMPEEWKVDGTVRTIPRRWNLGIELGGLEDVMDAAGDAPPSRGVLKAFDPLTGETRWEVEQSHHWNGGVLATAGGLVLQGNSEGKVNAFDSDTGEPLWSFNAYTAFLAPPISYQIEGRQYVAILAGTGGGDLFGGEVEDLASVHYGNAGKLLVFALDGTATLPAPTLRNREIPELMAVDLSPQDVSSGKRLYYQVCSMCHGAAAKSAGSIPDLRMMSAETRVLFKEIVLGGIRASKGMASFADTLTPEDADQILAYVTSRAIEDRADSGSVQISGD